jgi:hypothetical protein
MSCVSVIVKNSNLQDDLSKPAVCVLSGDLFEKEEDIFDPKLWIVAGSENPGLQKQHRLEIAKIADFIVPGHGPIFKVTDNFRLKLQQDFESDQKN